MYFGCFWLGNSDLDFETHTRKLRSKAKSENGFNLREFRPHGGFQLRNPNPYVMDLLSTVQLFSWTVVFFLLIMRACG